MNKDVKIPPAPTVYCPKDGEQVPIWYCLGSLTQGREACPYLVRATVHGGKSAEVECKWKKMKGKIHLLDPAMPEDVPAPLCTVRLGLSVTKNPEEVTCGNCLKMMKRQKRWKSV